MIVQLIVTGELEKLALHTSLGRMFPEAEFVTPQFVDSVSSSDLSVVPTAPVQSRIDRFATAIVSAVDPGRRGTSPDLVLALDDVELVNRTRPEAIVAAVRDAVNRRIDVHHPTASRCERTRELVQTRCSFHLFAPMIEAYFFGEPAALRRAGAKRSAQLVPSRDLEDFETDDPGYLATRPGDPNAARHPKRYLANLCEPDTYRETLHGKAALASLDWGAVLVPSIFVQFARALFTDLDDALGRPLRDGRCHPATSRLGHPANILRNC